MPVHVADIRRSDWVRAIPYMFVRLRVNWVMPGIVISGVFAVYVSLLVVNEQMSFGWGVFAATGAALSGFVVLLGNLIFRAAGIAATAKKAGILDPFVITHPSAAL
jgi:hypothetical protein